MSVDCLEQLVHLEKIEATKRGQYWYTSRDVVQQYLAEAQSRGRRQEEYKQDTLDS